MAGLERLVPYIYHEKQQEGSMLCAQHALNSLLRTSQFVHLPVLLVTRFLFIFLEGNYVRYWIILTHAHRVRPNIKVFCF